MSEFIKNVTDPHQIANSSSAVRDTVDPHCVPVTPVDKTASIDFTPGGMVCFTFTKTQHSPDGIVDVVQARIEWPLALAAAALKLNLQIIEAGPFVNMTPLNALAS